MPIELKSFAHKFLKLQEFTEADSLTQLASKIDENLQILSHLYNIDISKIQITDTTILPYKIISFYSKLKTSLSFFVDVL